jgi:hypothetical protein
VQHDAGLQVVGAEVDEPGHHPVGAHLGGDRVGVQTVLQGEHVAVVGEPVAQQRRGRRCGVGLDRDDRPADDRREVLGADRLRRDGELLDRAGDRQPAAVDRGDVLGVGVAQQHLVPAADQVRRDGAPDGPGADDGDLHAGEQTPRAGRVTSLRAKTSIFNIEVIYGCDTRI